MEYIANPGKVGKELDGEPYSNRPLSTCRRVKVSSLNSTFSIISRPFVAFLAFGSHPLTVEILDYWYRGETLAVPWIAKKAAISEGTSEERKKESWLANMAASLKKMFEERCTNSSVAS